jgi:signal transduction histidine kinase
LDNLNIELDIDNYDSQLNTEEESIIFAIIEEAIGNAKKYATAEVIRISLNAHKDFVIAEIADDGKGFDVNAVKSTYDQRGSLGLLNMEERAQMIGGKCHIISAKGKGTTIRAEVPLHKD